MDAHILRNYNLRAAEVDTKEGRLTVIYCFLQETYLTSWKIKANIREMIKDPNSSRIAGIFNLCSFLFTFISIAQFCVETIPAKGVQVY